MSTSLPLLKSTANGPYFDDFYDDAKNVKNRSYLRVLFVPERGVQVREMNQLQTYCQQQIERIGNHIFKDGSRVLRGEFALDRDIKYIKVGTYELNLANSDNLASLLDQEIVCLDTGVKARIVHVIAAENSDPVTLFVRYTGAGTSGTAASFSPGDTFHIGQDGTTLYDYVGTIDIAEDAVGSACAFSVNEGYYYVGGFFVAVDAQRIILSKYTATPTCRVGLAVTEFLVTPNGDGESGDGDLYDNAAGERNESAPGAHRYKIKLVLTSITGAYDAADPGADVNFVQLAQLQDGKIQSMAPSTDYADLLNLLAERTYDESGHYAVQPWSMTPVEFWDDGTATHLNMFGLTYDEFAYGTSAQALVVAQRDFPFLVADPGHNNWHVHATYGQKFAPGQSKAKFEEFGLGAKLNLKVTPGWGYVKGFRVGKRSNGAMSEESTPLIPINKARSTKSVTNGLVEAYVGSYIRVTGVTGLPAIHNQRGASLYPVRVNPASPATPDVSTSLGTCRVRGIEWDSGDNSGAGAVYKLYVTLMKLNAGATFAKTRQIYTGVGGTYGSVAFSCNVVLDKVQLTGTVASSPSADNVLIGSGTFLDSELAAGDGIVFVAGTGLTVNATVVSVTQNSVTFTQASDGTTAYSHTTHSFSGGILYKTEARLQQASADNLVFPFGAYAVDNVANVSFTQLYRSSVVVGSSSAVVTLTPGQGEFDHPVDVVLIDETTGAVQHVQTTPGAGNTSSTLTVTGLTNGHTVDLLMPVLKGSPTLASKTLQANATVDSGAGVTDLRTLSLGQADIYRVSAVYMSSDHTFTSAATSSDTDVTDRFELDNGQTDIAYTFGSINLKPGAAAPTGRIHVVFDYFTCSSGDYFSQNSYPVGYEDIPSYYSSALGTQVELRDAIDFRPRVDTSNNTYYQTGGMIIPMPVNSGSVQADYVYYLNRIDKIFIDQSGAYRVKEGVPSENPVEPVIEENDGMVLATVKLRAYTFGVDDVFITMADNKRFTMRDIGRLEKRIENLEYYTTLNMLEKNTESLSIKDDQGLDRFKAGFIVDPFTGHGIGDTTDLDYRCAIDIKQHEARPQFYQDNVALELNTDDSVFYTKSGDVATIERLPDELFIQQPFSNDFVNVNPFNVFTFTGVIELTPPQDDWKDTVVAAPQIVSQEGDFEAVNQMVNGLGVVWNDWQDAWVGSSLESQPKTLVSQRYTQGMINGQVASHYTKDGKLDTKHHPAKPGKDRWPIENTYKTTTILHTDTLQTRTGVRLFAIPKTTNTSMGEKVISVSNVPWIRSRALAFSAKKLKPNTRVYPFFDSVDVSAECAPAAPGNYGDPLITNDVGEITGTFLIPNTAAKRFATGERVFKLTSDAANGTKADTKAQVTYVASGLVETKQETIVSVRNAQVVSQPRTDSKHVYKDDIADIKTDVEYVDPLAQTFLVERPDGVFLSSIKLFFKSKDSTLPIMLQVREVVNGYPGKAVVPFSQVILYPASVNLMDTTIIDPANPNFRKGTEFGFESPVYLPQGEWCFVLMSDCNAYEVFISNLGPEVIDTPDYLSGHRIAAQPSVGSMFESQNASTWTANQMADIMFELNVAKFRTDVSAEVVLTNTTVPTKNLQTDPLEMLAAATMIRVHHANHGMPLHAKVRLSGLTATAGQLGATCTDSSSLTLNETVTNGSGASGRLIAKGSRLVLDTISGTFANGNTLTGGTSHNTTTLTSVPYAVVNGIALDQIQGNDLEISNIQLDSYTITAPAGYTAAMPAIATGFYGGSAVLATENKQMDVVHPVVQVLDFPTTSKAYFMRTTEQSESAPMSDWQDCLINSNAEFDYAQMIESAINNIGSFKLKCRFATTDAYLSPVLDLTRCSAITIANRLNSPSFTDALCVDNQGVGTPAFDKITFSAVSGIYFVATTNQITCSDLVGATQAQLLKLKEGQKISLTGAANSGNNFTQAQIKQLDVSGGVLTMVIDHTCITDGPNSGIVITQFNGFIGETASNGGTAAAKYVTKRIELEAVSDSLQIMFSHYLPPTGQIRVFYKLKRVSDSRPFEDTEYVEVLPTYTNMKIQDMVVSTVKGTFNDWMCQINGLPDFTAAACKIVFTGSNSADVPRVSDLRMIAMAKGT